MSFCTGSPVKLFIVIHRASCQRFAFYFKHFFFFFALPINKRMVVRKFWVFIFCSGKVSFCNWFLCGEFSHINNKFSNTTWVPNNSILILSAWCECHILKLERLSSIRLTLFQMPVANGVPGAYILLLG